MGSQMALLILKLIIKAQNKRKSQIRGGKGHCRSFSPNQQPRRDKREKSTTFPVFRLTYLNLSNIFALYFFGFCLDCLNYLTMIYRSLKAESCQLHTSDPLIIYFILEER